MPKKPFNFDVTGRELFDSERSAVNGFLRRYASANDSAHPTFDSKNTRGVSRDSATGAFVNKDKATLRPSADGWAVHKTKASRLSDKERKAVIFGTAPTAGKSSGPKAIADGQAANDKLPSGKRTKRA